MDFTELTRLLFRNPNKTINLPLLKITLYSLKTKDLKLDITPPKTMLYWQLTNN